jgi:hypothetical protein
MRPEDYQTLSPSERLIYNEMVGFAGRLSDRITEVADLLKRILKEADGA